MREFNRNRDSGRSKFGGRDGGNNRGGFGRRNGEARPEMFDAVCDNCGDDCRVPFRPTGNKPIYCSQCFEDLGNGREDRGFINSNPRNRDEGRSRDNSSPDLSQFKEQLGSINAKLDKILRIISEVEVIEDPEKLDK